MLCTPICEPTGRDRRCLHLRLLSDRKSTRLNSSHSQISYPVFCLKTKNKCFFFNVCRNILLNCTATQEVAPASPEARWCSYRVHRDGMLPSSTPKQLTISPLLVRL